MKKDILKIIESEKEKSQKKIKSATFKIDAKLVESLNLIAEHNKINKNILIEKILIQADIIEIADEIGKETFNFDDKSMEEFSKDLESGKVKKDLENNIKKLNDINKNINDKFNNHNKNSPVADDKNI